MERQGRARTWDEEQPESDDDKVDIGRIYTAWGKWSKCRRKTCQQTRKRFCAVPQICGDNVLKEKRKCDSERRRCRRRGRRPQKGEEGQKGRRRRRRRRRRGGVHIVKRKKLSRRTRGMLKFNKGFYSSWSRWSTCSSDCKATRTRTCKFTVMCGASEVHEEAYCYTEGDDCHKLFMAGQPLSQIEAYREGRLDLNGESKPERPQHEHRGRPPAAPSLEGRRREQEAQNAQMAAKHAQCGVRDEIAPSSPHIKTSPPSWALKIIGGREASRGHWPWQVALVNQYKEVICGGTLVAPGWVLTAAHCVRKHLYVRMNEHDLIIREGAEREFFVEHSVKHPAYNPDTVDNDVALLRVPSEDWPAGPASLGGHPNAACLPHPGQRLPPVGTKCTIIGWGKQRASNIYGTDVLHEAEVPIVSKAECLRSYEDYYITPSMFCAGYKEGRIDTCAGDSGEILRLHN